MRLAPLRDFLRLLAERFVATRCPQVAGSLTFTTLLALVPLLTVTLALFGNFPGFDDFGTSLKVFLLENLLPDRAGQIIARYAFQFSEKAARLTVIGTALLVVTALMLLLTIDRVFNQIWGVRRPRPLLTRLTVYWFALTLGPLALGGSVVATGHLVATSAALAGEGSWIAELAARVLPPILLGGLFSFLYYAVPNHPVRAAHALAGGIVAALAFLLMQRMLGLFIARFPTYTLIYGAFAAMPIFLVWLYLSWVVVLLGALLSATLPEFFERKRVAAGFPGDRAWAAINMLAELAAAQQQGRCADSHALQALSGLRSDAGEDVLGAMREAGWIARTEEGNWVLAVLAERLRLSDVVARFALSPAAWTSAPGTTAAATAALRLAQALHSADLSLAELAPSNPARRTEALLQVG